jgi:hypothetical protein
MDAAISSSGPDKRPEDSRLGFGARSVHSLYGGRRVTLKPIVGKPITLFQWVMRTESEKHYTIFWNSICSTARTLGQGSMQRCTDYVSILRYRTHGNLL